MKKQTLYIVCSVIVAVLLPAIYGWFFVYNKPHKNIENTNPDYTVTAQSMIQEFEQSDTVASRKYDDKVIQLTGIFQKVEPADTTVSMIFDFGGNAIISAQFLPKYKTKIESINVGSSITIKGLYNGYITADDAFGLPGNILINKCSPVK